MPPTPSLLLVWPPIHRWLVALFVVSLSGCYRPWDVTHYEPYSAYTGRTLILKRPCYLYKQSASFAISLAEENPNREHALGFYIAEKDPVKHAEILARMEAMEARRKAAHPPTPHMADLPVGTRITIRKVMRLKDVEGGGFIVDAFGDVAVPGQAQPVRFDYSWGYDHLHRAPWEDESVPADRPAGYYGKFIPPKP